MKAGRSYGGSAARAFGLLTVFIVALIVGAAVVPGFGRQAMVPDDTVEQYPNRSILHLFRSNEPEGRKGLALQASTPAGKPIFTLPGFCESSWSPRGDAFACNIRKAVLLGDRVAHMQVLAQAEAGEQFIWNPAWAPQGNRLALLSVKERVERKPTPCTKFNDETVCEAPEDSFFEWSLQIFDVAAKKMVLRFALSEEDGTEVPILGGWPFTMIAMDKFAWSPDGRQILISWGYASLVNVETGQSRILSKKPMMVDWDREGRLWSLEISMHPGSALGGLFVIDPETLQRREIASKVMIEAEKLTFGLSMARLVISPSGTRMILAASQRGEKLPDVIRVYDITEPDHFDIRTPVETFRSDSILQMDWSPDSRQIVVSREIAEGTSAAIATDVIDLQSHAETRLSTIPISREETEGIAFLKHLSWTR